MDYTDDIELINATLLRLQGWKAMLWLYNPTHRRIIVRLYKIDHDNDNFIYEKFLLCVACLSYSGPIDWDMNQLAATVHLDSQNHDPIFRLIDKSVGLEIVFDGGISLTDECPDY